MGSHLRLLLVGAAAEDQLRGDLVAGADRADADIAARQLLGDDAHRLLAEAEPAELLGDGEAEHAELGHLADHFERDVGVGAVPCLRVRHHLGVGELAHLLAHGVEDVVEPAVADGRAAVLGHQGDQAGAVFHRVAGGDELVGRAGKARRHRLGVEPEIGGADELALAHQDAAGHLRQELAGADADQQLLDLAEPALLAHALRVGGELADRLDIGREPGEAVGGALLALDRVRIELAGDRDPFADLVGGVGEQRVGGASAPPASAPANPIRLPQAALPATCVSSARHDCTGARTAHVATQHNTVSAPGASLPQARART